MNVVLNTTWEYLGCHDYINDPHANCILEAISIFYDCENKQAKEWFKQKLSNEKELKTFFCFEDAWRIRSDAIEALQTGLSRLQ